VHTLTFKNKTYNNTIQHIYLTPSLLNFTLPLPTACTVVTKCICLSSNINQYKPQLSPVQTMAL